MKLTTKQIEIGGAVLGAGFLVWLWRRSASGGSVITVALDDAENALGTGDGSDGEAPPAAENLAEYKQQQYPPNSVAAIDLFTAAAKYAGLPIEWANMIELHNILAKESQGWVGLPNYHFG